MRTTKWMNHALCREMMPNAFFPHDGLGVEAAKLICKNCSVTSPCLEYALSNRIQHGVWGGHSERQRRRIRRERANIPVAAA